MSHSPAHAGARIHLAGVPRISFEPIDDRCPEQVPFASALRATLEFLGESEPGRTVHEHGRAWRLDPTYVRLEAACGAAFRLSWGDGWQLDNPELAYIADDPGEPHTRAFAAVGRSFEFVHGQLPDREAVFRARVRASLEAGIPVIAFGLVGPPEASLITGLDEDDEVAIGWSCFQGMEPWSAEVELEPSGELRRRGWVAAVEALAVLGERTAPPTEVALARSTIEFALRVARRPWIAWARRHNGHAAFEAWATALADEADWATLGPDPAPEALLARYEAHDDAVGITAETRWYAARWCELTAERLPAMAAPLREAGARYDAMHDRMWRAWEIVGGPPRTLEHARALADPRARSELVALIRETRADDVAAVGALAAAAALG